MKKIIAAFDGLEFSDSNLEYAINITLKENAHLTGIFLDDRTYTSYKIYELVLEDGVSEKKLSKLKHDDELKRKNASKKFEETCIKNKLKFNTHHDKNYAAKELIHETVFADLLVVSRNETFSHHKEKFPSRFISEVLSESQCPVLLTPDTYADVEKVVFLYDGHPNSMYALKMFAYLMPGYLSLPIEVVTVKSMEENLHIPEGFLMKEWIKRYFGKSEYVVLKGIPDVEAITHLQKERASCLIVLGSYKRSRFSMWLRSSLADGLAKNFEHPLFIAHQLH